MLYTVYNCYAAKIFIFLNELSLLKRIFKEYFGSYLYVFFIQSFWVRNMSLLKVSK